MKTIPATFWSVLQSIFKIVFQYHVARNKIHNIFLLYNGIHTSIIEYKCFIGFSFKLPPNALGLCLLWVILLLPTLGRECVLCHPAWRIRPFSLSISVFACPNLLVELARIRDMQKKKEWVLCSYCPEERLNVIFSSFWSFNAVFKSFYEEGFNLVKWVLLSFICKNS